MRLETPLDLLSEKIQGLYHAECQLRLALPRVAARAGSENLRAALENHLHETLQHATRLNQMADLIGAPRAGKVCHAMMGLLREGQEALGYGGRRDLQDSAIISACQNVEHYEIAEYTALRTLAEQAGQHEIAQLAAVTLDEEERALRALTNLARSDMEAPAGAPAS